MRTITIKQKNWDFFRLKVVVVVVVVVVIVVVVFVGRHDRDVVDVVDVINNWPNFSSEQKIVDQN